MACNATRIELSNSAATTLTVTLTTDPGDGVTVLLIVDGLGITTSGTTSGGSATLTPVPAVVADTNSLWDAIIQVGTNRPAVASVQVTETNTAQNLGITITDSEVTYCAPIGGGGGGGGIEEAPEDGTTYGRNNADWVAIPGGGDAVTAGNLSQFADVTYGTIRASDILARSTTGQWNNQRPEYLRVDRRPICGSWYAAEENDAGWGVPNVNYRKTPATGADMSSTATNGKLRFIEDRFLLNTIGANGRMRYGFERYSIGNPAGMHLSNTAGFFHYPAIAGSGLTLTESTLRSEDNSTVIETLPTPFTDDGTTSGTPGDNIEAWQYAIQHLRDQFQFDDNLDNTKNRPIEVSCYLGYKPQYTDAAKTTYERTALGVNPNFPRSEFPGFWDDGFWSVEWAILESVGFDTLGFDTGGRMWFDGPIEGRSVIDGCIDTINDKFFVEAIARQSGGIQEEDSRCYENVRSLTIFPQLASIVYNGEEYTKIAGDGSDFNAGSVRVSQWKLDPANTECHVLFNWFDIKEDARFTQEIVEGCAREAHRRGFVVGAYNVLGTATIPATDGGTYSAADFCKFVEDLYLESVNELRLDNLHDVEAPAPTDGDVLTWNATSGFWEPEAPSGGTGAVDSVNGETGVVVLTGDEIDTTAVSGVSVTTELNNKATAASLTGSGGNVSGTISTQANVFSLTASLDLDDLDDVSTTTGSPGDGALLYKHQPGGGSIEYRLVDRDSIGLSEFDNDLPAVQDSYLMLIESPSDKTYIIDGRVAAGRTVTNFYAKTSSGTCTATLKNVTDTTTIGTISVTSTGGSAASLTNTSVTENERLSIEISSNSSSADLELVVEYTQ
jgi:hypothetical protein